MRVLGSDAAGSRGALASLASLDWLPLPSTARWRSPAFLAGNLAEGGHEQYIHQFVLSGEATRIGKILKGIQKKHQTVSPPNGTPSESIRPGLQAGLPLMCDSPGPGGEEG